ncbi:MAG: response regulator, partial [Gammaproteobacteria bacterium]
NAEGDLIVTYTTSPYARRTIGSVMADEPWMQDTVAESLARFGELVTGPPEELRGKTYSAVALRTDTVNGEVVILGRIDYTALIDSLYKIYVPPGMQLLLEGQFLSGERQIIWGARAPDALHSARTRTLSAGAELTISWGVTNEFAGGPSTDLARFTLVGGIGATLGLTFFIALLLWRNQIISNKVREATRELASSQERFELAMEATNLGVYDYRPDSGQLIINDRWAAMLGYTQEDIGGHVDAFSKLLHPDDEKKTWDLFGAHAEGKSPRFDAEFRMRNSDGNYVWIRSVGKVVERSKEDAPLRFLGIHTDITQQREAAEELRSARERADSANAAKSAFLANMSHELRTPMNAILGYSEMLMEEAEELEQTEFIPDLKKISQAGTHLLALINDVLDLSKIESGKMEIFPEEIDVAGLIDEVIATAHPLVEKQQNRLVVERDENLGKAHQDLTKVRQTLFNLLSNASKFTENGTITLKVSKQTKQCDEWLSFAVSDTGIGIPEDKLEHIFKEFSQADESTTRDFGGTGLGLSISKRFCQMLGGEMKVESVMGEGSTFTILIPATAPGAKAEKLAQATESREALLSDLGDQDRILVIDDDPEACEIISRFLRKDGFNVVTTDRGEHGLELAHQLNPAAITLDVMMPEMDGWSVLRALKADPKLRKIPVIMLSMIDERTRGYSLGAVDYLTKPVDKTQLLETLHRYKDANADNSVLIVEDEADARDLLAKNLGRAGWRVTEAANGREGLMMMATDRPNLVLLDLMMPVMDGFEFLAVMRKRTEWKDVPVIVVTAKTLTQEDYARLNGSVEQVIRKTSCSREELLERVRQAVQPLRSKPEDVPEGL